MVICVDPKPVKTLDEAYYECIIEMHDYLSKIHIDIITESGIDVINESVIEKLKSAAKFVRNKITEFFNNVRKRFNEIKAKFKKNTKVVQKVEEVSDVAEQAYEDSVQKFDDYTQKLIDDTNAITGITDKLIHKLQSNGDKSIENIRTASQDAMKQLHRFINKETGKEGLDTFENIMGNPNATIVIQ